MYKRYIEELKNGKQIRIRYNRPNHDGCDEDGWWSEELWCYDCELNIFKCYYPVSSYKKDFYTWHTKIETASFLREAIRDFNMECEGKSVVDIIVEGTDDSSNSLSIRELAIEKINTMSDDEIERMLRL